MMIMRNEKYTRDLQPTEKGRKGSGRAPNVSIQNPIASPQATLDGTVLAELWHFRPSPCTRYTGTMRSPPLPDMNIDAPKAPPHLIDATTLKASVKRPTTTAQPHMDAQALPRSRMATCTLSTEPNE